MPKIENLRIHFSQYSNLEEGEVADAEKLKFFEDWVSLSNLCRVDPKAAWGYIRELVVNYDFDEIALANLAAGPFEDLIHSKNFDPDIFEKADYDVISQLMPYVWVDRSNRTANFWRENLE